SSVVRGSIRSSWSLPLIRSVIGTAPSMSCPRWVADAPLSGVAVLAHAATTAATAVPPVATRKLRRLGLDGADGRSFFMGPPTRKSVVLQAVECCRCSPYRSMPFHRLDTLREVGDVAAGEQFDPTSRGGSPSLSCAHCTALARPAASRIAATHAGCRQLRS